MLSPRRAIVSGNLTYASDSEPLPVQEVGDGQGQYPSSCLASKPSCSLLIQLGSNDKS